MLKRAAEIQGRTLSVLGPRVPCAVPVRGYVGGMYRSAEQLMFRRIVAWAFGLVLVLAACAGGGGGGAIALGDYCEQLYAAGCVVMDRCMPGTQDRAACLAMVEDAWDGCPLACDAAALGEATYDPAAARTYVDLTRNLECGASGPAWLDPVTDVPVFTPGLVAGETCHSDISCAQGLSCDDVTVAEPVGICAPQ